MQYDSDTQVKYFKQLPQKQYELGTQSQAARLLFSIELCIMRQLLIDVLHTLQLLEVLAPQLFTEM